MFEIDLQLFGGRGASGIGGYSEYYQNRLRSISEAIREKEKTAKLADSRWASIRKEAASAQKSVDRLRRQYAQVEAAAKRDRRGGGPF